MIVFDDADCFFQDKCHRDYILRLKKVLESLKRPIQQLFFSATYRPDVIDWIANIVENANIIKVDIGAVHLPNV